MGHVYCKLWIHIVWSTKNRYPFLCDDIRKNIFNHMLQNARKKDIHIDLINGYLEHVHILDSLNPKNSISDSVNLIKGESSHWINSEKLTLDHFAWQNGFSAFSVSESQVDKVRKYILNQEEHHKNKMHSYLEEIKKLYELHNIKFDEKDLI